MRRCEEGDSPFVDVKEEVRRWVLERVNTDDTENPTDADIGTRQSVVSSQCSEGRAEFVL
jgi:hypothetical protein